MNNLISLLAAGALLSDCSGGRRNTRATASTRPFTSARHAAGWRSHRIPPGLAVVIAVVVGSALASLAMLWTTLQPLQQGPFAPASTRAVPGATVARIGGAAPAAVPSTVFTAEFFEPIALNALLVPLLGDQTPPRWEEPAVALNCVDAQVSIDDHPLKPGAPVPAVPFRMRWELNECAPLGDGVLLSGTVDAMIVPEPGGYHANLRPQELALDSDGGRLVLWDPFAAQIGVGP